MEKDDITFAEALKQASDLERIAHDSKLVGRNETSVSQVQKKPDHRGSDHRSSEPRQFKPSNDRGYRPGNQFHNQHAPQRQGTGPSNSGLGACRGCGKNHRRSECKYTVNKMKCNACGIVGHKASVCQRKHSTHSGAGSSNWRAGGNNSNTSSRKVRDVEVSDKELPTSDSLSLFTISRVESVDSSAGFTVEPMINGIRVRMDLDTCAEVSVASSILYEQLGKPTLTPAPLLRAYGGSEIPTLGQCDVEVEFRSQRKRVPLVFAKSAKEKGLFGRPWIEQFNVLTLDTSVNSIDSNEQLSALLDEYADVFATATGCIRGHKAHLYFKDGAQFRMNKCRPVPYAFQPAVEKELERLQSQGIISPVDMAEFTTTPLVVVQKPNGAVRICGDFKVSVNPHLNVQHYPMPTCAEVFQKLRGGQHFTKLDLADAYLQLELDEESRRYTVFTTHKGLFRVNRLAFGLACAPAIFQSVIEQVLAAIPHTQPYLDDIVVTGATTQEHLINLRTCLNRMRAAGIRLRRDKCRFFEQQIEHLGHLVDSSGVRINPAKTDAIRSAPPPKDKQALESWLGMAQYYGDFIPRFSTLGGSAQRVATCRGSVGMDF